MEMKDKVIKEIWELYFDEISEDKLKQAIEIAKKSFKISSQKVEKLQLIF